MYGWTGKSPARRSLQARGHGRGPRPRHGQATTSAVSASGSKYLYDEIDPAVDAYLAREQAALRHRSSDRHRRSGRQPLRGGDQVAADRRYRELRPPRASSPRNLKYAGYDMIIFEGKAEKPGLPVDRRRREWSFGDADGIWGKDAEETEKALIAATAPDAKVACIGPAGEKLVRFACVMNDMGRAAGRSGVGAVMGSKNLKAVAVRGTKGVKVADQRRFYAGGRELRTRPRTTTTWRSSTRPAPRGARPGARRSGRCPTRNFQHRRQRALREDQRRARWPTRSRCASAWAWAARPARWPADGSRKVNESRLRRASARDRSTRPSACSARTATRSTSSAVCQGQLHLQRDGHGYDLHGQLHRVRHGDVRARPHSARRHRLRPDLRRRQRYGEAD